LTGTPAFLVGRIQENGALKVAAVVKGAQAVGAFVGEIDRALRPAQRAVPWQMSGSALW
jgi:hypothetical protein